MPKSARRQSAPKRATRTEPYPAIKPRDKPTPSKTAKASPKALAEKTPSEINAKSPVQATDKPSRQSSFLDLPLEGEPGSVPIYDTCSVICQKINALLRKDNTKPENAIPGEFKKDGTPKPYTKT